MNHRIFGKQLGRNHHERQALIKSLSKSLFTYGAIETTRAKAQLVVPTVEDLANCIMTKDVVIAQREMSKYFQDRHFVKDVYDTFKATFAGQTSNFTKFWNVKYRQGDDALIVKLSFVKPYTIIKPVEKPVEDKKKKVTIKKDAPKKLSAAKSRNGGITKKNEK
jgi:large subunit ribosomal protein L17